MMESIESCFTHSRHPVRVLQFGEGRFMRAFVDYAIDVANEEQGFDGNVVIVTPRAARRPESFARQQNLYTVRLQGMQNGRKVVSDRSSPALTMSCPLLLIMMPIWRWPDSIRLHI